MDGERPLAPELEPEPPLERPLSRQALLLVVPSLRTIPWVPLLVAVALGSSALAAARAAEPPPPDAGLAIVGALIAVWFASLLGDRSAAVADGTPPHVLFRRAIRLAVGVPIVVLLWVGALTVAAEGPYAVTLSFLFGAEICVALGVAAVALHVIDPGREVLWAAGGLLMVFVALPFGLGLDVTPIPRADTWWLREGRWLAIGGGGAIVAVLASLDPAARHLPRLAGPRRVPAPAAQPTR